MLGNDICHCCFRAMHGNLCVVHAYTSGKWVKPNFHLHHNRNCSPQSAEVSDRCWSQYLDRYDRHILTREQGEIALYVHVLVTYMIVDGMMMMIVK